MTGEDAQRARALAFHRRAHGLRIGVHGGEAGAERGEAGDAAGDRVADIVQLEVDEDLLALADQLAGKAQPPAKPSS